MPPGTPQCQSRTKQLPKPHKSPQTMDSNHNTKSGTAALMHQSGSILDIATVIFQPLQLCHWFCQLAPCALSVVQGLCRAANSCKAGLVVGALRITYCVQVHGCQIPHICRTSRMFFLLPPRGGSITFGTTIDVPPYSNPYVLSGLAPVLFCHSWVTQQAVHCPCHYTRNCSGRDAMRSSVRDVLVH